MAVKFKYGDPVRFLNDIGGGTVKRIDEHGMVHVLTYDGFEIPVPEKELVIAKDFVLSDEEEEVQIQPAAKHRQETRKSEPESQDISKKLAKNVPEKAALNLWLGFIPENPGPVFNNQLACYLVNDSPCFAYYMMGIKEKGRFYYLTSGLVESDTKNYIRTFNQTEISKISDFHIQLIWYSDGLYSPREPVNLFINLNMVNFSKESYYRENEYFNEKALLFQITGKEQSGLSDHVAVTEGLKEEKIRSDQVPDKQIKKQPVTDTMEIDLHPEALELTDDKSSQVVIFSKQMARFHDALEEAVSKKLSRLVIIHGVGQGILKMQIRKELQEKYPQFIYQDASFKEYGFGATMVHLTYRDKQ
jgi:hypothetical protein